MIYDQVGTLRLIVGTSGNITKRIDYDSFGNIISDSNTSFEVPFGFSGGLHDIDTGLVRFGARDFDPAIGRWTAKDPIDFVGGDVNLYGYVQNNPVNFVDPLGLFGWTDFGAVVLGGAGVAAAVAGAPVYVPIALIGGAIALHIYGPSEALQTIDNTVEKFKDMTKDHLDRFDELDKATGRGCP